MPLRPPRGGLAALDGGADQVDSQRAAEVDDAPCGTAAQAPRPRPPGPVADLRAGRGPAPASGARLGFAADDVVVVSGLPGSGKSTLIGRAVPVLDGRGAMVRRIDSQDVREQWERRLPPWLPYAVYRPGVRVAHYVRLGRALRSGGSLVVHDCGHGWVRRWAARRARRHGRLLHLILLDVPPPLAAEGQVLRGRTVSRRAFARHCRTVGRLVARLETGRLPDGCASAVILDRASATALHTIAFD